MRAKIAYSVLACLTMAALFVPVSRPEDFVEYTKVGSEVPSFTLTTLDGREFSTAAARGKVVLLNFWATWCPPCVIEMPRLEEEIWKEHRGPDFEMLAVAREQTGAEIREYRDKHKYSFPGGEGQGGRGPADIVFEPFAVLQRVARAIGKE